MGGLTGSQRRGILDNSDCKRPRRPCAGGAMIDHYQRLPWILLSRRLSPGPVGRAKATGRARKSFRCGVVVENQRSVGASPTGAFTVCVNKRVAVVLPILVRPRPEPDRGNRGDQRRRRAALASRVDGWNTAPYEVRVGGLGRYSSIAARQTQPALLATGDLATTG